MTSDKPAAALRDAAYFDQWYTDMAASPTRDAIVARALGLPPEPQFGGVLTWQGIDQVGAHAADAPCRDGTGIRMRSAAMTTGPSKYLVASSRNRVGSS
jgi:hypothetical protein